MRSILPVNFIYIAGAGLLLAVLTGVGSFVFGAPFFNPHIRILSAADPWENGLATATIFDLGVYLVVVGVTMTIIQTIGEEE